MEKTNLITIPTETILDYYKKENGLEPVLDSIKELTKSFIPDMSTVGSRKEISSMAYKVSQSKVILEKLADDLVKPQEVEIKKVKSEKKRISIELDKLRDEIKNFESELGLIAK